VKNIIIQLDFWGEHETISPQAKKRKKKNAAKEREKQKCDFVQYPRNGRLWPSKTPSHSSGSINSTQVGG
jgi:hypothetical protein